MAISERRLREKARIKQSIYDAAVEIMLEEGYGNLSIRKIAKKIEYSPTLIYNYYENREEILHNVFVNIYEEVMREVVPTVESNHKLGFDEQFKILVSTFVSAILKQSELFRALLQSDYNMFVSDKGEALRQVSRFIRHGQEAGEFTTINETTPELIIITMIGVVSAILNKGITTVEEQEKLVADYCDLIIIGLKK
ncbi:MAG: TetR/AcrR family transcriptional regulator [Culicoidibacterales bacterium]